MSTLARCWRSPLERLVAQLRTRIEANQYASESAVREAVVLPVLQHLGWDIFDPNCVIRECPLGARKVDYALSSTPPRREIFIEVKALGAAASGDRQLFEYAFHEGIPFAVPTDGREWHFFLPGEQGSYDDRRVQKLDLTEREPGEVATVLQRFLSFSRVKSGEALESARADYRSISRRKTAASKLNEAWHELLGEPDELLMELVAEKAESLCGYRPAAEDVEDFLIALAKPGGVKSAEPEKKRDWTPSTQPSKKQPVSEKGVQYQVLGERRNARNAIEALLDILRTFAAGNPRFLIDLAPMVRTKRRNHIGQSREEVYPNKPELVEYTTEITPGWWLGTNIANREKMRIIRKACDAQKIQFGKDLAIVLPNAN